MCTYRPPSHFLQCPGCLQAKDNILFSSKIRSTFPGRSAMFSYIMAFCAKICFSKYRLSQAQNNKENIGHRKKMSYPRWHSIGLSFFLTAFSSCCIILQLVCLVSTGACRWVAGGGSRVDQMQNRLDESRWGRKQFRVIAWLRRNREVNVFHVLLHGKLLAHLFSCQRHWERQRTIHTPSSSQLSFWR